MPTPQRSNARESLSFRNLPKLLRDAILAACRTGACGFAVYTRGDTHLGQPHLQPAVRYSVGFDFLKSQASFDIGELSFPTIRPTALLEPCWWDCSTPCE